MKAHWAKIELPKPSSAVNLPLPLPRTSDALTPTPAQTPGFICTNIGSTIHRDSTVHRDNTTHPESDVFRDYSYLAKRDELRSRLRRKFPVSEFNAVRKCLDPNNVLGNELIDTLFSDD